MITFLNKIARKYREKNYFFRRFFDILTDNLWVDKMVILKFDLDKIDLKKKHEKIEVRWNLATEEDCEKWFQEGACGFEGIYEKAMIRSLQRNDWVLLGYCETSEGIWKPQCHLSCVFHKAALPSGPFQLRDDEGYIFSVFTTPSVRGCGLAAGCLQELCRIATEQSFKRLFINISTANTSSIRSAEKAGSELTDTFFFHIRFLKKSYILSYGKYKDRFVKTDKAVAQTNKES